MANEFFAFVFGDIRVEGDMGDDWEAIYEG